MFWGWLINFWRVWRSWRCTTSIRRDVTCAANCGTENTLERGDDSTPVPAPAARLEEEEEEEDDDDEELRARWEGRLRATKSSSGIEGTGDEWT